MMYYFDMDWQVNGKPVSLPGNLTDIAIILAWITLLLVGADACTPCIISKVWGENKAAQLALGAPRGDLLLIRWKILTHQKVAMNTLHIWLTNPLTPIFPPDSEAFKLPPRTIQHLLLDCLDKRVFAHEPVPSGERSTQRLTDNLKGYIIADSRFFEEKAIRWYSYLLLGWDQVDDQTGFNNGIIIAYGMCPPCTLQKFYEGDPKLLRPTHFMRGTADEIWSNNADPYGVMRTMAEDWTVDQKGPTN